MVYVVLIAVFLSVIGGGAWYYKDSQERIAALRDANTKIELALEATDKMVENMELNAAQQEERLQELDARAKQAEEASDALRSKLRKHNLTNLADKKPGLIEKRINDASNKVLDSISNNTSD